MIKAAPHDLQNEMAALGAMIYSPDAIYYAKEKLTANDFYKIAHQHIYNAIETAFDGENPVDINIVKAELKKKNKLEKIGGVTFLREVFDSTPNHASHEMYINIVRSYGIRRQIISTCEQKAMQAHDEGVDETELLDRAEQDILAIRNQTVDENIIPPEDILYDVLADVTEARENPSSIKGLSTGFNDLDRLTTGLRTGFYVIAARPSVGKTTFCLNALAHNCIDKRIPAIMFSVEMHRKALMRNLLCIQTNKVEKGSLNSQQIITGRTGEHTEEMMEEAINKMQGMPLYIDDTAALNVSDMRARARRHKQKHGIELVVIDYMQLLKVSGKYNTTNDRMAEISSQIKAMAKELEVPVISVAQLNRSNDREQRPPRSSDLRDSGAIEQDADLIMLLHRIKKEQEEDAINDPTPAHIQGIVDKHREGPQGIVDFNFEMHHLLFTQRASNYGGDYDAF